MSNNDNVNLAGCNFGDNKVIRHYIKPDDLSKNIAPVEPGPTQNAINHSVQNNCDYIVTLLKNRIGELILEEMNGTNRNNELHTVSEFMDKYDAMNKLILSFTETLKLFRDNVSVNTNKMLLDLNNCPFDDQLKQAITNHINNNFKSLIASNAE